MEGSQGGSHGGAGSYAHGWGTQQQQQQGGASGSSGSSYQAPNGNSMNAANQPLHFSPDHVDVQQKDSQVGPMRSHAAASSSRKSNLSEDVDADAGDEDGKAGVGSSSGGRPLVNPPVKAACTFCRSR